jgi:ribosomal protein L22
MNHLRPLSSCSISSLSSRSSASSIPSLLSLSHRSFSSVRRAHPSMAAFRDFLSHRKSVEPQRFPNVTLPSMAESTRKILEAKQKLPRSFLEPDGSRPSLPLPLQSSPPSGTMKFLDPPPMFVSRAVQEVSSAAHFSIKIPPQKLNDICRRVRGLHVDEALVQLRFAQKRKAVFVANAIRHAAMNGIRQYQMDRSRLFVAQAWVGKGQYLKRPDFKARAKFAMKVRYYSHVFIELREQKSDPSVIPVYQPPHGSPFKQGLEVRVGRFGRRTPTIQKTLQTLKNYTKAKSELGISEYKPIPVNRRIAEINDYSEALKRATQIALQSAGVNVNSEQSKSQIKPSQ